jgi:hypothetical protein
VKKLLIHTSELEKKVIISNARVQVTRKW